MRNTLAALVVFGALTAAPVAFADETAPADPVAETQFVTPAPQPAEEAQLVAEHRVAAESVQQQTAGRMEGQDPWVIVGVSVFLLCAVFALAL